MKRGLSILEQNLSRRFAETHCFLRISIEKTERFFRGQEVFSSNKRGKVYARTKNSRLHQKGLG